MHYINCLEGIKSFEESKSILQNKGLVVKEYDNLYLVKYVKGKSDMKDTDVRKCRGIILEKNSNRLLCAPPQKSIDIDYYHNLFNNNSLTENIVFDRTNYTSAELKIQYNTGTSIQVIYNFTTKCMNAHGTPSKMSMIA